MSWGFFLEAGFSVDKKSEGVGFGFVGGNE